ncbi:MAG: hypothetical protein HYZ20_17465 [Burkholderiales bacterium]|nr:hypothetical protein [Burkholderiales bacterium]
MFRCALLTLIAAALAAALPAAAEPRPFPASALRAEFSVEQPPQVRLDGRSARLAPGARIRSADNLIVVPAALAGQVPATVHYTVDSYGLLMDVWVLTAEERALQPWPRTAAEAAAWRYDPLARRWSKP